MRKKTALTLSAVVLMCVFSALLPGAVLALRDMALTRSTETVAVDEVELSLLSTLDTARKLQLAGDSSAAAVPLKGGRAMTETEAADCAVRGQQEMGLYLGPGESSVASARLIVSGGGESMVVWDVTVSWPGSGVTGRYIVDDETGGLLGIELRDGGESGEETFYSAGGDETERDVSGPAVYSAESGGSRKETAEESAPLPEALENGVIVWDAGSGETAPDPTDAEIFHEVAGAFLKPLGLEYLLISVEGRYSAFIHLDSSGGRVLLPVSVRTEDTESGESFLSLNMQAALPETLPDAAE